MTQRSGASGGVWRMYAGASVILSVVLGFGLGAGLFVERGRGDRVELAWIASAQVHGHAQLFGFAVLMVIGVALHFLPRLAGGSSVSSRAGSVALGLLAGGILLRTAAALLLANSSISNRTERLQWLLLAAVVLELAGVVTAGMAIGRALDLGRSRRRDAFAAILPLAFIAIASLVLALLIDAYAAGRMIGTPFRVMPAREVELSQFLIQYGTLLAISVAMSARLFPLYIRTPLISKNAVTIVAALLAGGLVAGGTGIWTASGWVEATGRGLLCAAAMVAIWKLGLLRRRRPLPRQQRPTIAEPLQWFVATAYAWLVVALITGWVGALGAAGVVDVTVPSSMSRHAFGAGFVTLLILGVGQSLLPGFAKTTLRSTFLAWILLVLGNIGALFRFVAASGWVSEAPADWFGGVAGIAGIAALLLFAWNCRIFHRFSS
ncbi:MAG: NnrS family protein [Thermomicrobiales bacterium]|nr:NnrS family protein [Thermomicrobiales bacterium]